MKKKLALLFALTTLLALLCAPAQAGSDDWECGYCLDRDQGWSNIPCGYVSNYGGWCHKPKCNACENEYDPVACNNFTTATCTSGPKCGTCGQEVGSPLGHDYQAAGSFIGKAATCTEPAVCGRCGEAYGTALGHDWQAEGSFTGEAATCTEPAVCGRCGETYGTALGHDYKESVISPACGKRGYTLHTCALCGDNYRDSYTSALSHYYGVWTPKEESSHQAACVRSGCSHKAVRDCDELTFALDAGEVSLCPVCGRVENGDALTFIPGAKAAAVDGQLPRGELALYWGKFPDGTEALTVAFECDGKLVQPEDRVRITLPLSALEDLADVHLVAYGLESDEASQPLTAFTGEIPLLVDGETVSFEVDFTSDAAAPAQLLLVTAQ